MENAPDADCARGRGIPRRLRLSALDQLPSVRQPADLRLHSALSRCRRRAPSRQRLHAAHVPGRNAHALPRRGQPCALGARHHRARAAPECEAAHPVRALGDSADLVLLRIQPHVLRRAPLSLCLASGPARRIRRHRMLEHLLPPRSRRSMRTHPPDAVPRAALRREAADAAAAGARRVPLPVPGRPAAARVPFPADRPEAGSAALHPFPAPLPRGTRLSAGGTSGAAPAAGALRLGA